jgi:hypothetical protein
MACNTCKKKHVNRSILDNVQSTNKYVNWLITIIFILSGYGLVSIILDLISLL